MFLLAQSTYCKAMRAHCETHKRLVHIVNLDPAAEELQYAVSVDVRELITLEDVMAEEAYGPNGALVYCMEYLVANLDWLHEQLGDGGADDDYLLLDCPGQIELYTHFPVMRLLADALQRWDYRVCAVWLVDAPFVDDAAKFVAGSLAALSAMLTLGVPHINVLSKVDLLGRGRRGTRRAERWLDVDAHELCARLDRQLAGRFARLNRALATLLDEYALVGFVPLDVTRAASLDALLAQLDHATQYGEDHEPRDLHERDPDPDADDLPDPAADRADDI